LVPAAGVAGIFIAPSAAADWTREDCGGKELQPTA
jgi:hypothetical protein